MISFCHIIDSKNIGDKVCCPIDYIDVGESIELDIREDPSTFSGDAIIFGGGGMLHPWADLQVASIAFNAARRNQGVKLVAWGIGTNYHGIDYGVWPGFLGDFDIVGIRDKDSPYRHVPCPSCMNTLFDSPRADPVHEFVVYSHWERPLSIDGPSENNSRDKSELDAVLNFLASGSVVVTNTYHGAYWAALLGRQVIIVDPFSNRFHCGFSFAPTLATSDTWKDALNTVRPVDGYLEDCRKRNEEFMGDVLKVVCV